MKTWAFISAAVLVITIVFVGCKQPTDPKHEPQFFDSIETVTDYLDSKPANTVDTPYTLVLSDITIDDLTEGSDPLGKLFASLNGKYVSLDLSDCEWENIPNSPLRLTGRPDRDKIVSVNLPKGIISLGSAFRGCTSLASITIGNSVTSIGDSAFDGCTSLASINVGSGNAAYSSLEGILYNKAKTEIIYVPRAITAAITIPDGVTSIGDSVFYNCTSLASITIGNSVTSIGDSAFYGCTSLVSITIPNSVTSIGSAFSGCTSLASITIPDSVTSIGNSAFYNCTSLASINVGSGNAAYSSLEGILYNKAKTEIIRVPGAITAAITIPDGVTSIGNSAFRDCTSLASITIPNSVTSIGSAFSGCTSLASITIPDSVTSISWDAFYGCTSLTSVTFDGNIHSYSYSLDHSWGDLMDKYLSGRVGTYTTTAPVSDTSVWTKQ